MAFRFDMKDKTPQQQIIVAKRDADAKRKQQEAHKKEVKSKMSDNTRNILLLVVDKDTCPDKDNIIYKQQCASCEYYKGFKIEDGQPCVECLYK